MRIAVVVKAVAALDSAARGWTLNPFCRRAVAQACDLAVAVGDGTVHVLCCGPAAAADVVHDALRVARESDVEGDGVLLDDPAFEGSDTLRTARALAAAIRASGDVDLVLAGRHSVDVGSGQVAPQLAELLQLPFVAGARYLSLHRDTLRVRAEHDDGWAQVDVDLPAVVSCAERLIDPPPSGPRGRGTAGPPLRRPGPAALGAGPWGRAGSAVRVEAVTARTAVRQRHRLDGPLDEQVVAATERLRASGALDRDRGRDAAARLPPASGERGDPVAVLVEPTRVLTARQLLAAAARAAAVVDGHVVALVVEPPDSPVVASWGADAAVHLQGSRVAEDVAATLADWVRAASPRVVVAPGTTWGVEVLARAAARLDAGLIGGAVDVTVDGDGGVRAEVAALGGEELAVVTSRSPVQLVTVRPGALVTPAPRASGQVETRPMTVRPRSRLRWRAASRDDDLERLANADAVVGVGLGVPPSDYPVLGPLLEVLDAELAATRPVVDRGWLPHARQVGLTGQAIAPRLYVLVGSVGAAAHLAGVRAAGTVVAVHPDRDAPVFDRVDVGIVGDWRSVVPRLAEAWRGGPG